MRFWYLSQRQAAKAQAILRICAELSESWLLADTFIVGIEIKLRPKFRPIALLILSAWVFIRSICAHAISTKNLCAGSNYI